MLHGSSLGSPTVAPNVLPCANLARAAMSLLGDKPANQIDVQSCWDMAAWLLIAAGQACPATGTVSRLECLRDAASQEQKQDETLLQQKRPRMQLTVSLMAA